MSAIDFGFVLDFRCLAGFGVWGLVVSWCLDFGDFGLVAFAFVYVCWFVLQFLMLCCVVVVSVVSLGFVVVLDLCGFGISVSLFWVWFLGCVLW